MVFTFVIQATQQQIQLKKLSLSIKGCLDLRGMLALDQAITVGFDTLHYQFHIESDASQTQLDDIASRVRELSPNFATLANPVQMVTVGVEKL